MHPRTHSQQGRPHLHERLQVTFAASVFQLWSLLQYQLRTLWLFTYSDLKTTVFPMTIFSLSSSLSGPVLTANQPPGFVAVLSRIPQVTFWIWIHTLFINVGNQRQPAAAKEDELNKPWRPLPSKRITPAQAKVLMLALHPTTVATSIFLGAVPQCVSIILLGYLYNDLGGADRSCIIRNALNAVALPCFGSGATMVILNGSWSSLNDTAYQWFSIISLTYFTTVQIQDMEDQVGDAQRQRCTLPLIIGDRPTRWTIAIPVTAWSFICPSFFEVGILGFFMPVLAGLYTFFRVLLLRTVDDDKQTFRIWNLWMMILFVLPLFKHATADSKRWY